MNSLIFLFIFLLGLFCLYKGIKGIYNDVLGEGKFENLFK